jgi:DNA-binding CsgD family transcriptional regulator/predicted ATPase
MPMATEPGVIGRDEEVATVLGIVASAAMLPTTLVIEGEPGIGKTTLWQVGISAARERRFQVLTSQPAESERKLSFAALRDLLENVYEEVIPALPPPKQRALGVAMLHEDPGEGSSAPGVVAAAFLSAVRHLSSKGPVLIAVDDLQWIDRASEAMLQFAVRRLQDEPISFLLSRRAAATDRPPLGLERLPVGRVRRLELGQLSLGAIHRLIRLRIDAVPLRPTLRRIHELSQGNPFFALEIARALAGSATSELTLMPATLQQLISDRLSALPRSAQGVLRVAAATAAPDLRLLEKVARRTSSSRSGLQAAVAAGVLQVQGDRIRFVHPLLASGVYAATPPAVRRDIHRALAALVREPEERARHLALSRDPPDSYVAAVLVGAARRARARGAMAAAAELAEHALRFTPPSQAEDIVRRMIDAAGYHFDAGDAARARIMLEAAVASASTAKQRARSLVQLARANSYEADIRTAASVFRRAIAEAVDDDRVRAEAEHGLASALFRMLSDLPTAVGHARAAAAAAETRSDSRALCEYLATQGLIEGLLGESTASATMARAVQVEDSIGGLDGLNSADFLRNLRGSRFMPAVLGVFTDDLQFARQRLESTRTQALELGDEGSLPLILRYLSYLDFLAGDWTRATQRADEGYDAAIQTGQLSQLAVLTATRALLEAHLGQVESARSAAKEALQLASQTGAGFARLTARSALGVLELSLGEPAAALSNLGPLLIESRAAGLREPTVTRYVGDAIEALLALGRSDEAETLLADLEATAGRLDRASALAVAARCRGLLRATQGNFDGALASFGTALAAHQRIAIPFDYARSVLALGSVERRAKQKQAARRRLEEAVSRFERLGARLWVARAHAEIGRIGGRSASSDQLTATELGIARLVAAGRTNREIASEVFLSAKTVEFHLRNIYRRLGIGSRAELARQVGERAAVVAEAGSKN